MAITLRPGRTVEDLRRAVDEFERVANNFATLDTGPDRQRLRGAYRSLIDAMERTARDYLFGVPPGHFTTDRYRMIVSAAIQPPNIWHEASADARAQVGWFRTVVEEVGAAGSDDQSLPWSRDGFRLFMSHIFEERAFAAALKGALNFYGVDAFVAHADIQPSHAWEDVIKVAIRTCDAFLALLQEGFRESAWCDQEVGYAIAEERVIVPGRFDRAAPQGFLGRYQALNLKADAEPTDNAAAVVQCLLSHPEPATVARLVDAMVHRVVESNSFQQTNRLLELLVRHEGHITSAHVDLLESAQQSNTQVAGAWHAPSRIENLRRIVDARSST